MSTGRPSETQAPFGYTFVTSNPPASTSSYPPPGPPLLDNIELGYLESFFEDPSNVDSNLPSFPGEYQGDTANIFSNTNLEWAPPSLANLSDNNLSIPPDVGPISQTEQRGQIPASADVYAAAGILHSNTMRQQDHSPYSAYPVAFGSAGPEGTQINGYGYGSMPNGEFDFGPANNGFYSGGYEPQDLPNPYMTGLQSRLPSWNGSRPSGPLNFGSDPNFRNSNYTLQTGEAPDKQLVEAVNHNFGRGKDSAKSRQKVRSSGQGSAQKRGRQPGKEVDAAMDIDEAESSSEEDAKPKRWRKSRIKEENEDGDLGGRSAKSRKSKKKQVTSAKSATSEDAPGSSPISKKHTAFTTDAATAAAAAAAAAAKERRENLTEEQKRSNHIQSEQKRRNLIKQGFEDLNQMVPELRSSGQSKSNMLVQAAIFMRQLKDDNDELRAQMESLDNG